MIIPIRCVSCGNVIAGKYPIYVKKVKAAKGTESNEPEYLTATTVKTVEGKILDEIKITRMCCRRHFLTHVELLLA